MHDTAWEHDLVTRAAAGDEHALESLLLTFYDRLARRIERRLPKRLRSVIAAEDILQQTFIAVSREITTFEATSRGSFFRWLCAIAEFRILDAMRHHGAQKRGGDRQLTGAHSRLMRAAGAECSASHIASRREANAALRLGMASLNEDYRRALHLRYVRGLDVADVASIMRRSPHAVHNLCHRALGRLRAAVGRTSRFFTR